MASNDTAAPTATTTGSSTSKAGMSSNDRRKTTMVPPSTLTIRHRLKSLAAPPRQRQYTYRTPRPDRPLPRAEPLFPTLPPVPNGKVKPLSSLRVPSLHPSTVLVPATPSPPPATKPNPKRRAQTARPAKPAREPAPSAFPPAHTVVKLAAIHGLGSGVFATRSFSATEIIFAEKPLFKARRGADAREILDKTRALPQQNLLLLLTLEANGGPNSRGFEAIFRSNAIPCVEEDEGGNDVLCAIFKYLSRVNHSCAPNCGWFWDTQRNLMLVIAFRDIAAGEEITASYIGPISLCNDRAGRNALLRSAHHFECLCRICARPHPDSDTNRSRLGELLSKWEGGDGIDEIVGARTRSLAETREALRLAKAENLTQTLIYIYLTEFYVHAAWGDLEAARESARKALESLAKIRGWEAAKRHYVAAWADDPTTWESWGILKDVDRRKKKKRRV